MNERLDRDSEIERICKKSLGLSYEERIRLNRLEEGRKEVVKSKKRLYGALKDLLIAGGSSALGYYIIKMSNDYILNDLIIKKIDGNIDLNEIPIFLTASVIGGALIGYGVIIGSRIVYKNFRKED